MGVNWGGVTEIPNLSNYAPDEFWPDDNFSDASQSMDELLDRNNSLGQDEGNFFSLDESALDEMAREISSDRAFHDSMQDMPKLDPSDVDSSSDGGISGYMTKGAGLVGMGKVKDFILSKISSFRSMPDENDDVGLDELLDLDDVKNSAYKEASESTRNGFGVAANAPAGVGSAA